MNAQLTDTIKDAEETRERARREAERASLLCRIRPGAAGVSLLRARLRMVTHELLRAEVGL